MRRWHFTLFIAGGLLVSGLAYTTWNVADPRNTCARCHEIQSVHENWQNSAHADIACTECHGSALSGGLSGLAEKTRMVFTHFREKKTAEDLFLNEEQSLAVSSRCATCHRAEQSAWNAGAHSATYRDIFLDEEHNRTERPYADCLRCHGMFYDGEVKDLLTMEGDPREWRVTQEEQASRPVMTCLACHQTHAPQSKYPVYGQSDSISRSKQFETTMNPRTALYVRADKRHLSSGSLRQVEMQGKDSLLRTTDDPDAWLCMQCHAPNGKHMSGTSDDMTPTGPYQGMSCLECHDPHSNQLKNNFRNVHQKK